MNFWTGSIITNSILLAIVAVILKVWNPNHSWQNIGIMSAILLVIFVRYDYYKHCKRVNAELLNRTNEAENPQ